MISRRTELTSSTALSRAPLKDRLSHFVRDKKGNVGLIFGLMVVPLMGLAGAAIDYSQAARARSQIQDSLDAGALAGAKALHLGDTAVRNAVRQWVDANAPAAYRGMALNTTISSDRSTVTVSGTAAVPTSLLNVIGIRQLEVGATSQATTGNDTIDISLAVDVTGSMQRHIGALRTGATDFMNIIFQMDPGGQRVRAALVPFNAAVNIGNGTRQMAWMDTNADNSLHGINFENRRIHDRRCDPPPPPPGPPPPPCVSCPPPPPPPPPCVGCNPPPPPPPPGADLSFLDAPPALDVAEAPRAVAYTMPPAPPSAVEAEPITSMSGRIVATIDQVMGMIGPSAAQAQAWPYGPAPANTDPVNCNRRTPTKVNHFDLFRAMRVNWSGCVEARPHPFDVTDEPPNRARPETLFVPYLWPDEGDAREFRNNYMDNAATPNWLGNEDYELQQAWVWKYQTNPARVNNTAQTQTGPNGGCPEPLVPLTGDRNRLLTSIAALRTYGQGGTNTAEGIAWAWRTVTPGEPFNEARPDATNHKRVVVLMTDGANFVIEQETHNQSDYGAYNFGSRQVLGPNNPTAMRNIIDQRFRDLCRNIKAQNIIVYTIMYEPNGNLGGSVANLLRQCATSPAHHFFHAASAAQLITAFNAVAAEITKLRLSR